MFDRDMFEADLSEIDVKSRRLGDSFRLVEARLADGFRVVYLTNSRQFVDESNTLRDILTLEYHVVFSESFECPVLYLNVSRSNGSLLSYNHLYQLFGLDSNTDAADMIFTQQEHPVLQRPFFFLHPCKTNSWMKATEITEESSKK